MTTQDKLADALRTVLNMDVKGHRLQDRLQFSTPGRAIGDECLAALAAHDEQQTISATAAAFATLMKLGYVWNGGYFFDPPDAALAAHASDAAGGQGDDRMPDSVRDWLQGMSVSLDVSTCDADAGHRYMGTVTEVMDDDGDKHGVTLLVQDAEPNFAAAPSPQETK